MKGTHKVPEDVRSSVLGARIFYFVMFGLFYVCVIMYPNKIKKTFTDFSSAPASNLCYIFYLISLQAVAVWYFLTAGENPGFVKLTKTDEELKEEARQISVMSAEQEDRDPDDCDGFDSVQTSLAMGSALKNMIEMRSLPKQKEERREHQSNESNTSQLETQHDEESAGMISKPAPPVKAMGYSAPMVLPAKRFCLTCNLQQPYRSRHCHDCNQCVRKFDHHCFWIGGCVGELNHGKFWLFLFFQTWL